MSILFIAGPSKCTVIAHHFPQVHCHNLCTPRKMFPASRANEISFLMFYKLLKITPLFILFHIWTRTLFVPPSLPPSLRLWLPSYLFAWLFTLVWSSWIHKIIITHLLGRYFTWRFLEEHFFNFILKYRKVVISQMNDLVNFYQPNIPYVTSIQLKVCLSFTPPGTQWALAIWCTLCFLT